MFLFLELYKEYRSLKQARERGCNEEASGNTDLSRCTSENPAKTVPCIFSPIYFNSLITVAVCWFAFSLHTSQTACRLIHAGARVLGKPPEPQCTAGAISKALIPGQRQPENLCSILWPEAKKQLGISGQGEAHATCTEGHVTAPLWPVDSMHPSLHSVRMQLRLMRIISLQERPATLRKSSLPGRTPLNSLKAAQPEQPRSPFTPAVKSAPSECNRLTPR